MKGYAAFSMIALVAAQRPISEYTDGQPQGIFSATSVAAVTSQPAIVTSQPSVVTSQPAVVTSQPVVVTSQPAIVTSQSGSIESSPLLGTAPIASVPTSSEEVAGGKISSPAGSLNRTAATAASKMSAIATAADTGSQSGSIQETGASTVVSATNTTPATAAAAHIPLPRSCGGFIVGGIILLF